MQTIWISPTEYVTGDSTLAISYPSAEHPNTTVTCKKDPGDYKWVSMGLRLPPDASIQDVIVCYQLSNATSYISQIRLQEMDTPDQSQILHDDVTDLQSVAAVCYTSNVGGKVPGVGKAVALALRLNFSNKNHRIMLGAVGVRIEPLGVCSLNARDFGAKGDGDANPDADDTIALQAAFDAVPPSGAMICVPPGVYLVSQFLRLRSNTYLKGAGSATLFKRTNGGGDSIFYSETVHNVTVESISIDLNGAGQGQVQNFANGLAFRIQCSNIRIRDVRIMDSTGTNVLGRHGILVLESDHVWIERNHLTDGFRIKAGGVGDKLIIENNIVEDGNDNAITIATATPTSNTINYIIRGNIVKAARGFGARQE